MFCSAKAQDRSPIFPTTALHKLLILLILILHVLLIFHPLLKALWVLIPCHHLDVHHLSQALHTLLHPRQKEVVQQFNPDPIILRPFQSQAVTLLHPHQMSHTSGKFHFTEKPIAHNLMTTLLLYLHFQAFHCCKGCATIELSAVSPKQPTYSSLLD